MDPNTGKSQGEGEAVEKLEQDLQNLSQQATAAQQPVAPPASPATPPIVPVETKKGSPLMIIAIILAVLAVLAVVAYVFGMKFFAPKSNQTACTLEAKICPDGSSVGRTGPNCEFTACPVPTAAPDITANWKMYTNSEIGFSFKYPQEWTLQATSAARVASFDTKSGIPGEFFVAYQKSIGSLAQWLLDNKAGEIIDTVNIYTNQFSVIKGGSVNVSREYAIKVGTDNYLRLVVEPYPNSVISDGVINQILSTFTFTEATPAGNPTASPSGSPSTLP